MSLVDGDDLAILCSKLKLFQSKLLRKWVQGLGSEQRAAASGTTLSWQCSRSTTNAISELLLFCVYVCVMRYIFISVLFSLGVRGVCVSCGYEDRIHFGRILEALSGLDKD